MIKIDVEKLKKTIYEKGYPIATFSKLCGKGVGTLSKAFERGTISPKFAKIICEKLNIEFKDYFTVVLT